MKYKRDDGGWSVFGTLVCVVLAWCLILNGCSSTMTPREDRNTVSDPVPEKKVLGVTYDKGPVHPTFWEWAFARLGIR